jgi:hypothetical protein
VTPDQFERVKVHLARHLEVGASRVEGKGALHFFTTSDPPDLNVIRARLPKVQVELLQPVLPVVTRPERKPQLFDTMMRWREIAAERQLPLWEEVAHDIKRWISQRILRSQPQSLCTLNRNPF